MRRLINTLHCAFLAIMIINTRANSQTNDQSMNSKSTPVVPEIWQVEGYKAYLHASPEPAPGKPWVWYAPTVNGNFIILQHKMYYNGFLQAGIAVATCDLGEVRGSPASSQKFTLFYQDMIKRGYSQKPILLGQSRGGLMTLAWAFRNPDKVKAWAGIYPVCNLEDYPMKLSKKETLVDYAMSEDELRMRINEFNPIHQLAGLAKNHVPMFSVHGDNDPTVPYDLNTKLLKENYRAAGGSFSEKVIPGGRHEVTPSFFKCQELLDFILQQAKR